MIVKKLIAIFLAVCLVMGLCACTNGATPADTTPAETEPAENNPTTIRSIKILAIGNSFSVDAMQHLYTVMKAEGVEEIVLGNLYIGGCPLDKHNANAKSGEKAYKYYKNTTGEWQTYPNMVSILEGIQDEEWDVITMQQGSAKSGVPESYEPDLTELIAFVSENKTNPDAKLYWHMTWAYQSDSDHSAFPNYGNNQNSMYLGIVNAMEQKVETIGAFEKILPVGTAIQNARTGFVGDTLTRDGFHLSDFGRAIAAYTWYAVLDGQPLRTINVDKFATANLTDQQKKLMVESINAAIANPHAVTQSQITTP